MVDKVCKFENLIEELATVQKQIGLPEMLDLPRVKSKHRKDTRSYREILSEADKGIISEIFREEIDLYGYKW